MATQKPRPAAAEIKRRLGLTHNTELAKLLGVGKQAVTNWGDGPIPNVHWLRLKHELRPDVFAND